MTVLSRNNSMVAQFDQFERPISVLKEVLCAGRRQLVHLRPLEFSARSKPESSALIKEPSQPSLYHNACVACGQVSLYRETENRAAMILSPLDKQWTGFSDVSLRACRASY
jgi:hypothetical protein